MQKIFIASTFALLAVLHFADGIFLPSGTGATGATVVSSTLTPNLLGIGTAVAGTIGASLLLGALSGSKRGRGSNRGRGRRKQYRGRRETSIVMEDNLDYDAYVKMIHQLEPEDCMKKMICILAANGQDDNLILFAFGNNEEPITISEEAAKAEMEYRTAAKVGESFKDISRCDFEYKCKLSTSQIFEIASSQELPQ